MYATVMGLVRHVLTYAGGTLVANGMLSDSDASTGIGAITALIGVFWSAYEKRQAATKVQVALALPAGSSEAALTKALR